LEKLAIIIPAYKGQFLQNTLRSIANQTNQNFRCYIFDDASPEDIASIVRPFTLFSNFSYHKFSQNMGGYSLTKHWERCIDKVAEPFVWLFSDDDEMDYNCVESFYTFLHNQGVGQQVGIFRFQTDVIDDAGTVLRSTKHPSFETNIDFFKRRLNNQTDSFITEFIFSKSYYDRVGGFQHFPLAWCADDAFWFEISQFSGINTLATGRVRWRYSQINISGSNTNVALKKLAADLFVAWCLHHKLFTAELQRPLFRWHYNMYRFLGIRKHILIQHGSVLIKSANPKSIWAIFSYFVSLIKQRLAY
jgi:glycosyltransferase involved in cell wall biosynthesis